MPTITIEHPADGTPSVTVASNTIRVSGTSSGGTLRKVWVTVLPSCSSATPAAPWDLTPEATSLTPPGSNWEFLSIPCNLGSQCVRVWGAFDGDITLCLDNQPFVGEVPGSGSGVPEPELVSTACTKRGGVPSKLYLTISRSTCEALNGRIATLRWNGSLWKGALKLPDKSQLPCTLEAVKGSPNGKPRDFRLSFGERKPQQPNTVCCEPLELVWNEKKAIRLGLRGSKICPPGTTAEVTVSE